jgi:hypothetical protein
MKYMKTVKSIAIATCVILISTVLASYVSQRIVPPQDNQAMIRLGKIFEDIERRFKRSDYITADCTPVISEDDRQSGESDNSSKEYDEYFPPDGNSGDEPYVELNVVAHDGTYGYTRENPIKVGGDFVSVPRIQRMFLNSLYGPDGELITYERVGSCCPFKTENGFFGIGLLDIYRIRYSGLKRRVILYLNMYDYEEPKVPCGFSVRSPK